MRGGGRDRAERAQGSIARRPHLPTLEQSSIEDAHVELTRGSRSRALTRDCSRQIHTPSCPLGRSSEPAPAAAAVTAAAAAVYVAAPPPIVHVDASTDHLDLGARRSTARADAPTAAADECEAALRASGHLGMCLARAGGAVVTRSVRSRADPTCHP